MYTEKTFECVECGRLIKKIVLEDTDTDNFLCPSCEYGEFEDEEE